MSEVEITADGPVLTVTFNRPDQRNAMTWAMYEALEQVCDRADSDAAVRVMLLRGAGGKAFVAGTDISQFAEFSTGQHGVDYERRVTQVLDRLQAVRVPTVAVIDGYCVGGGLGIACAVDLRVATPRSRFGVPIARTLGNCLSAATLDLLVRHFGESRTTALLLTARLMSADEALAAGFLATLTDDLDKEVGTLVERLLGHAPLSMWASKEALRRHNRDGRAADVTDIVARVYGSADFQNAVKAFVAKRSPIWSEHG
ncbi:enoyl-CoA hydratase/isomerase family protein [Amycolatopsis acidiphila]|uniref:Enoyl-CoA hydratase n=1 Tax=Amycolatopsis acidiphila TaxID=715473 RepID=A0A558AC79_9PSEU|nr:enoyl-CoA hydratase/isomerase family protein [Amycolatopsis acidiphila]TVT21881.1 enoyl-CoA hydratase [Amycolatopsis acidiphila]UIJ57298.1 enoyl-CoA hydratase/isomerase family protein [Amycolatopsis acidiphila]GHG84963.1 enoyl-CoA hydratase [Amycolatopsis acidiphila]